MLVKAEVRVANDSPVKAIADSVVILSMKMMACVVGGWVY